MAKQLKGFDQPGWIYIVRIPYGPTKIGLSYGDDPFPRLKDIDWGLPYPLLILGLKYVDAVEEYEQKLHREYLAFRKKGEWFDISDPLLGILIDSHAFVSEQQAREAIQGRVTAAIRKAMRKVTAKRIREVNDQKDRDAALAGDCEAHGPYHEFCEPCRLELSGDTSEPLGEAG
jgi:hypothetical protein